MKSKTIFIFLVATALGLVVLATCAVPARAAPLEYTISPSSYEEKQISLNDNEPLTATWDEKDGVTLTLYVMTAAQYAAYPGATAYEWVEYGAKGTLEYKKDHSAGVYYLVMKNGWSGGYLHVTLDYYTGTPFPWEMTLALLVILIPSGIIIYLAIKHRSTIRLNVRQTSQGTIITTSVIQRDEHRISDEALSWRTCPYCGRQFQGATCPTCGKS